MTRQPNPPWLGFAGLIIICATVVACVWMVTR